jgi:hypothetical protein
VGLLFAAAYRPDPASIHAASTTSRRAPALAMGERETDDR